VTHTAACDYAGLENALQSADADCGAAESHGLLCGICCAAGKADTAPWLEHILGAGNTLSAAAQNCHELLTELYAATLQHLNDNDLGLELLLPGDDAPLALRSRALGQWCQGFLYGLALGGVREEGGQPGTIPEIMRDFYEISQTGFDHDADDETEEAAYMEIVEYVRMSVLLCHEELQPLHTPATGPLH
jgi:yecA family protein